MERGSDPHAKASPQGDICPEKYYFESNLIPATTTGPQQTIENGGPLSSPLISSALSQHALLGFFPFRRFSAKREFNLHSITIILALTLSFAGLVFLIDPTLNNSEIYSF